MGRWDMPGYKEGEGGAQFEPIEAGAHDVQLAAIIHMPDQPAFDGGTRDRACFVFVTPAELDDNGEPRQIRHYVGLPDNPLHPKAGFRQMIDQWQGKPLTDEQVAEGFSEARIKRLLGRAAVATTTVVQSANDRMYAKLTAISPPRKGYKRVSLDGLTVRVQDTPGQAWLTAEGVTVEVRESKGCSSRPQQAEEEPELTVDDVPF